MVTVRVKVCSTVFRHKSVARKTNVVVPTGRLDTDVRRPKEENGGAWFHENRKLEHKLTGWTGGWMDGWMETKIDGWMDGWKDGR